MLRQCGLFEEASIHPVDKSHPRAVLVPGRVVDDERHPVLSVHEKSLLSGKHQ